MGFLNEIKDKGDELKDRATGLASGHVEKIGEGIDKAAEVADKVTGGKFTEQIDSADARIARAAKDVVRESHFFVLPVLTAAQACTPGR